MCTNFRTNSKDKIIAVRIVFDLIIELHSLTNDRVLNE